MKPKSLFNAKQFVLNIQIILLFFIFFVPMPVPAQPGNFFGVIHIDVLRKGVSTPADLNDRYPYFSAKVFAQGMDMLKMRTYYGWHRTVKYFVAKLEAECSLKSNPGSRRIKFEVPVMVKIREKGKFVNENTFSMNVVDRLVQDPGTDNPRFKMEFFGQTENNAIKVVKIVSESLPELLATSLSAKGLADFAITKATEILTSTVDELESKEESTTSFSWVGDSNINRDEYKSSKYTVAIMYPRRKVAPDSVKLTDFVLDIKGSELKLFDTNGIEYKDFPYWIIEESRTNYVAWENIPSDFFRRIDSDLKGLRIESLETMKAALDEYKANLSRNQYQAELELHELGVLYLDIWNSGNPKATEEEKRKAIDAMYDFASTNLLNNIDTALFKSQFGPLKAKIVSRINLKADSWTFWKDEMKKLIVSIKKSTGELTNDDLYLYRRIRALKETLPELGGSRIAFDASHRLTNAEDSIFRKVFSDLYAKVISAEFVSVVTTSQMKQLDSLSYLFPDCDSCSRSVVTARKHWIALENHDTAMRTGVADTVDLFSKNINECKYAYDDVMLLSVSKLDSIKILRMKEEYDRSKISQESNIQRLNELSTASPWTREQKRETLTLLRSGRLINQRISEIIESFREYLSKNKNQLEMPANDQ